LDPEDLWWRPFGTAKVPTAKRAEKKIASFMLDCFFEVIRVMIVEYVGSCFSASLSEDDDQRVGHQRDGWRRPRILYTLLSLPALSPRPLSPGSMMADKTSWEIPV
jgi:hypothetical protein